MYKKGVYRGNKNRNAALTEAEVRLIKQALMEGNAAPGIARIYGVSAETIRRINRGETWGWLDAEPLPVAPAEDLPPTPEEEAIYQASLERLRLAEEKLAGKK